MLVVLSSSSNGTLFCRLKAFRAVPSFAWLNGTRKILAIRSTRYKKKLNHERKNTVGVRKESASVHQFKLVVRSFLAVRMTDNPKKNCSFFWWVRKTFDGPEGEVRKLVWRILKAMTKGWGQKQEKILSPQCVEELFPSPELWSWASWTIGIGDDALMIWPNRDPTP